MLEPQESNKVIHYGAIPSFVAEAYLPRVASLIHHDPDINKMEAVMNRGLQRFLKTRSPANGPAVKSAASYQLACLHAMFLAQAEDIALQQFVSRVRNYAPKQSYIELAKERVLEQD